MRLPAHFFYVGNDVYQVSWEGKWKCSFFFLPEKEEFDIM